MITPQMKKVLMIFGAIFAFCFTYSLIYRRMYEPFTTNIQLKACKSNSDCPDKFKCENGNCKYDRPLP
jgi:hypothetical protein